MNRTNSACALLRKRRRAAALHDAVALAKVSRTSARFWSAPPLRRFGFSREVHGANAVISEIRPGSLAGVPEMKAIGRFCDPSRIALVSGRIPGVSALGLTPG